MHGCECFYPGQQNGLSFGPVSRCGCKLSLMNGEIGVSNTRLARGSFHPDSAYGKRVLTAHVGQDLYEECSLCAYMQYLADCDNGLVTNATGVKLDSVAELDTGPE